jgi:hypothetical protein
MPAREKEHIPRNGANSLHDTRSARAATSPGISPPGHPSRACQLRDTMSRKTRGLMRSLGPATTLNARPKISLPCGFSGGQPH